MSVQEIIAELEKMRLEERRLVAESLQGAVAPPPHRPRKKLSEVLLKHAGKAEGLPADMSANHDHYIYGTPKQSP